VSLRRAIIEVDPASMNVAEFCRSHGVSTWFFYDLRRRHRIEGDAVLAPKSRAPHHPAGRTPLEVEEAIVRCRKELEDAGWDCGPASIRDALGALARVPSEATIWRILTHRGLIVATPSKAPRHTGRSWSAERANECWALDDWTWTLADDTPVQILDVLDDHSRYAAACTAMPTCTGGASFDALADAASHLGWPARFWSDNARAFTATLATAVAPLGVTASHTRPYSPCSNGKVCDDGSGAAPGRSDSGQGVTVVSSVRCVDRSRCCASARAGRRT
jgi:transposase InsO family protein